MVYNLMKHRYVGDLGILKSDDDDCGLGKNKESKITGNAGKRAACAVIGIRSTTK